MCSHQSHLYSLLTAELSPGRVVDPDPAVLAGCHDPLPPLPAVATTEHLVAELSYSAGVGREEVTQYSSLHSLLVTSKYVSL